MVIKKSVEGINIGICFDTAHAHAFGLNILEWYKMPEIKVFHINDSVGKFGCRKDRHANIGYGTIPIEIFQELAKIKNIPLILETPHEHMIADIKIMKEMTNG